MDKKIIARVVFILLGTAGTCWAGYGTKNICAVPGEKQADAVEAVLKQLNLRTKQLKSYQAEVEYKFIQPLFESTALRKAVLNYAKSGKNTKLRINFETLKHDDDKEQKYVEHFIFDGVWLTHINYQTKQVRVHQLAEPDKPVDAFELASRNLPILGFSQVDELKKQFEIKLVEQQVDQEENYIHLNLKVKPDSKYNDKYNSIDFLIDKKLGLPAVINAVSTEEDIYQIKLVKPQVNKKIDLSIFDVKVPKGFDKEIIPIKKKTQTN
jgi:outer membrane lipoprotein-sorting protein